MSDISWLSALLLAEIYGMQHNFIGFQSDANCVFNNLFLGCSLFNRTKTI